MKLKQYIAENYLGNISAFAVANDMPRRLVSEYIDEGYYHVIEIDGELMLVLAKRKIIRVNNE